MSAQIRRKNDRSKLVEQDFGRRLYATNLSYSEAMKQTTQKYMDSVKLIKQSEFKKPYLEDDYQAMEYAYAPPDPPTFPPGPEWPPPDCRVGVEASGILKDWRECAPGNSCAAYIFTCAHKLISVMCLNCVIAKMTPLEGDRLLVIICSDRDTINIKYQTIENPSEPAKWKEFEEKRICCLKETVSIGYTSQQMSCNGTQVLTVIPGGGADDCYSWAASSGSITPLVGNAVTYTAPSSNANCANNPTITLTAKLPGGGTQTATLKIAVNCAATGVKAYEKGLNSWCTPFYQGSGYYCRCPDSGTNSQIVNCGFEETRFDCAGTNLEHVNISGQIANCAAIQVCPDVQTETDDLGVSHTYTAWKTITVDVRSGLQKTNGCCPAALIV